jgi:hypothetical protein
MCSADLVFRGLPGHAVRDYQGLYETCQLFDRNPALDVPPSQQDFNKSVLASATHLQPSQEAVVGEKGEVCCTSKL